MQVRDLSIGLVAEPEVYIQAGTIIYELNFKCDHSQAAVIKDSYPFATYSVLCLACRGEDLSEQDVDNLIADELESVECF